MTRLHKTFAIEVEEHRENGGRIRISTDSVDRYRDRVLPSGANIQNYMANPVVQWGHNYFEPWATIGKTNKIEIGEHTIDVDFDLRPAANQSDPQNVVLLLWNGGWINTASIGFNPMEKVEDEPFITENEHGGRDFLNWDLLEWSLVPIPANQDALRLAVKAFDGIPERSVELPNGNEIVYPQVGADPPEIVTSGHMKIVDDSTANESSIYQPGTTKLPGQLVDSSATYVIKSDPDIDAIVDLVIQKQEADRAGNENAVAWIREIRVSNERGEQSVFAGFHVFSVDIPEDAQKIDFTDDGELTLIPHPDAGKTLHIKEVSFIPPIQIACATWGDDAVYATGGQTKGDEEFLNSEDWETLSISGVLLSLPVQKAFSGKRWGLGLCRMTAKTISAAKRLLIGRVAIPYSAHGDVSRASEDLRWSGSGARRRLKEWAGGDEWDPRLYRRGFVQLDGESDLITSYKGPHHDIVDGTFSTVFRGAQAAMGSLVFGARGGRIEDDRERRAVYNHLAREYARFDRDAPEFREYSEEEVKDLFPDELYEEAQEQPTQEELDALAEQWSAVLEAVKTTI